MLIYFLGPQINQMSQRTTLLCIAGCKINENIRLYFNFEMAETYRFFHANKLCDDFFNLHLITKEKQFRKKTLGTVFSVCI